MRNGPYFHLHFVTIAVILNIFKNIFHLCSDSKYISLSNLAQVWLMKGIFLFKKKKWKLFKRGNHSRVINKAVMSC